MKVEPHIFVVLGANGDLVHRKVLPALDDLFVQGSLDGRSLILGVDLQTDVDDNAFRAGARAALGGKAPDSFINCLYYQSIGPKADDLQALAARIRGLEQQHHLPGNRIFYLALPPAAFPSAISRLGEAGLNRSPGWTRIVLEKPFGQDLASAQDLNAILHRHFEESQVYRIDHYLGKETVQNLLVFRFANALFETVWNRDRIAGVEITVAETLGVEHRAGYYDRTGALRDMVQNHLTQLLATMAMELPASFDAGALRYEKVKVLRSIGRIRPEEVAFGQYAAGRIDGEEVPGYREEPGILPDSQTETFVALKLEIANWRWHGVPFYLHTGKRLPKRVSQIAVTFRRPPVSIFRPLRTGIVHPNVLVITLQPDEGFDLHFEVKTPGQPIRLQTQNLHFRYAETFAPLTSAYHTLLLDVMIGDQTLFVSDDWVEASWRLYTPLLRPRPPLQFYAAGAWGPGQAHHISWPPSTLLTWSPEFEAA